MRVRTVRLNSLEDLLAEAERLAAAERAGTLRRLGNWTTGQLFGHVAYWIDVSFDGSEHRAPWFIRLIGPMLKKGMINKTPKPGFRLPGVAGGTYGTTAYTLDEGLARLRRAVARLQAGTPTLPNEVFGKMTRDEWLALHLRHAEVHLGFLVVEGDTM